MKMFLELTIILCLLVMILSCGKDEPAAATGAAPATPAKSFFSLWNSINSEVYLDLRGASFDQNCIITAKIRLSQLWIDDLNTAGRNTTGLVAGAYYICEYTLYASTSGHAALNHTDVDTPAHNACLAMDSNCIVGSCAIPSDHEYSISGNRLTVDYFGGGTSYGSSTFE